MKSVTLLTPSGNTSEAYVIASDATSALLYVPATSKEGGNGILIVTNERVRGMWVAPNWNTAIGNSIVLDKKSKANRDMLDYLRKATK